MRIIIAIITTIADAPEENYDIASSIIETRPFEFFIRDYLPLKSPYHREYVAQSFSKRLNLFERLTQHFFISARDERCRNRWNFLDDLDFSDNINFSSKKQSLPL